MKFLIAFLVLIALAMIWIRVVPSDPARWNKSVSNPVDGVRDGSVLRILDGRAGQMAELERIMMMTPRTKHLAGSVAEGQFTYVTRSLFWGFPDYATVWSEGEDLIIYSRLRFGGGDMGVNAKRVDGWIGQLTTP